MVQKSYLYNSESFIVIVEIRFITIVFKTNPVDINSIMQPHNNDNGFIWSVAEVRS